MTPCHRLFHSPTLTLLLDSYFLLIL
uniref:Uncharacterized protein n=1 Tax=Arundo donax TaxID=35708 RepID=A0A0A8ZB22_ARUDO